MYFAINKYQYCDTDVIKTECSSCSIKTPGTHKTLPGADYRIYTFPACGPYIHGVWVCLNY